MKIKPLLELNQFSISLLSNSGNVSIVDNVNISIFEGETIAVVGESGSGKSLTALGLSGLLPKNIFQSSGNVNWKGTSYKQLKKFLGDEITFVFQEPYSSFDPLKKIKDQMIESFLYFKKGSYEEAIQKAVYLLERVGITDQLDRLDSYPNQLSGGMLQRVSIAMALMTDPKLIILDEPTSAIDVTIQVQIIELLKELKSKMNLSLFFISHDLGIVSYLSDRVYVLYAGQVAESGSVDDVIDFPIHPYTRALLSSYPEKGKKPSSIQGSIPSIQEYNLGCRFYSRCTLADSNCENTKPSFQPISDKHSHYCLKGGKSDTVK
jgi:peptide/nickel transport system ATP-binding protein